MNAPPPVQLLLSQKRSPRGGAFPRSLNRCFSCLGRWPHPSVSNFEVRRKESERSNTVDGCQCFTFVRNSCRDDFFVERLKRYFFGFAPPFPMCALARALVRVLPAVAAVVWIVATVLQNNAKTDLVFSYLRGPWLVRTVDSRIDMGF